jgi:hypothetical protein
MILLLAVEKEGGVPYSGTIFTGTSDGADPTVGFFITIGPGCDI